MTVHDDLATLRRIIESVRPDAKAAADRVEAEIARLTARRSRYAEARYENCMEALSAAEAEAARLAPEKDEELWVNSDEIGKLERSIQYERDRAARLRDGLRDLESAVRVLDVMLREPAAVGLMSADDYRAYLQGAWLGVDEAAEKARDALAGPDAQTSGSGSSAADPSAGERQGRQPDPGEIAGLLVELSRWSRVAELNGDLHARIASALAGQPTAAEGPDTPPDSQEDKT